MIGDTAEYGVRKTAPNTSPEPKSAAAPPGRKASVVVMGVGEWARVMDAESVEWLWDGTAPLKHLTMLTAKQKAGKSTLLRNFIHAVTTGSDFLAREVRRGEVLYLPLEEDPGGVVEHLKKLGTPLDRVLIPVREIPLTFTDADGTEVTQTERQVERDLAEIEKIVRERHPIVLVVDPIIKLIGVSDLNDYTKVQLAMEPLLRLAMVHKFAIVFAHHEGKGNRDDVGQRSIGSTALPSIVHTTISIGKRADGLRTIENEGRNVRLFNKMVLTLDDDTGALTGGGTLAQHQENDRISALIAAAQEIAAPNFSRVELCDGVEGRASDVRAAFFAAVKAGAFRHCGGQGKKGDPKRYEIVGPPGPPSPVGPSSG